MADHNVTDTHPLAGQTVTVELTPPGDPQFGAGPHEFTVENWWDVLTGDCRGGTRVQAGEESASAGFGLS